MAPTKPIIPKNTQEEFQVRCRKFLKGEIARAEITHSELARRLTELGLDETEGTITMKISRGRYSAWFLVSVLQVLGRLDRKFSDI